MKLVRTTATKSFHLHLPAPMHEELHAEGRRRKLPATALAR
jgi:hypothetical protein